LQSVGENSYRAEVDMGVGPVRGRFEANVALSDLVEPKSATLTGDVAGPLGNGGGTGRVTLTQDSDGTLVTYSYEITVSGKVASVGGRMLDGAARVLIGQFFNALVRQTGGAMSEGLWTRIIRKLGLIK